MQYKKLNGHDPVTLEPYFSKHMLAMTEEDLHNKADIAVELAYRDKRIAELEQELAEMDEENTRLLHDRDSAFDEGMERAAEIVRQYCPAGEIAIRAEINK